MPYGVSKFEELRRAGRYLIDKTDYIAKLEARADFLFFVRPRRFGKSLFVDMLRCYYDQNKKKDFELLFGDLKIGKNPTKHANQYQVLALDFSQVNKGGDGTLQDRFNAYLSTRCADFIVRYPETFGDADFEELQHHDSAELFDRIKVVSEAKGIPLYLIIDEYDNFTNQLIKEDDTEEYKSITHGAVSTASGSSRSRGRSRASS